MDVQNKLSIIKPFRKNTGTETILQNKESMIEKDNTTDIFRPVGRNRAILC